MHLWHPPWLLPCTWWTNLLCLFVCLGFFVPLKNFSLIWRRQGLQILPYARYFWPLSSEGSLACYTYCETWQLLSINMHVHNLSANLPVTIYSIYEYSKYISYLDTQKLNTNKWNTLNILCMHKKCQYIYSCMS